MSPLARTILTAALLVVGVQVWLILDANLSLHMMIVLGLALLAAAVPWVHRRIFRGIQRVRHVSPRVRAITAGAVFAVATAYLIFTAFRQGRPMYPKYHDNQSYAIQAQIIASGKLWLDAHPLWEFFDTFHVIVHPVYASMYFPGAAIAYAPGALLHLPMWLIPVLIAAGCVAMLYRVLAEIVDGLAGLLGALWLVSLLWFRHLSTMYMSHPVLLFQGLIMLWAYLKWRSENKARWALLIGAAAGWGAITRPADALCYAAPIGVAILLDLRGRGMPRLFRTGAAIVAAAAPFLALQLVFNHGVTGNALTSPYRYYLDRDAPQLSFGFHEYDPKRMPASRLVQKQVYHLQFNAPLINAHRPERLLTTWFDQDNGRLPVLIESTSPSLILLPLLLAGLLGLTTIPRRTLFALMPLYCLLYLFYAAMLKHYTPVAAPATILLGMLGVRQAEALWPRIRAAVATFTTVAVVGTCVCSMPELNRMMEDDPFEYIELVDARENIPKNVTQPALVFVKFTPRPKENIHGEPVYNFDAARIDDNPIVFAHDLGAKRNVDLLRYYADRQPDRHVYTFDRATRRLVPRGSIKQEISRLSAPPSTTQPTSSPASD